MVKESLLCLRCKANKHSVFHTGSFLCKGCREVEYERLNMLYGNNVEIEEESNVSDKAMIEETKKLLKETDLSAAQISKKTGLKIANVYYYASRIRKKKDEVKKVVKAPTDSVELKKLEEENAKYKEEILHLKEGYEKELQHSDEKYKKLQYEYEALATKLTNDPKDDRLIHELQESLNLERKKHATLLEYFMLVNKEDVQA